MDTGLKLFRTKVLKSEQIGKHCSLVSLVRSFGTGWLSKKLGSYCMLLPFSPWTFHSSHSISFSILHKVTSTRLRETLEYRMLRRGNIKYNHPLRCVHNSIYLSRSTKASRAEKLHQGPVVKNRNCGLLILRCRPRFTQHITYIRRQAFLKIIILQATFQKVVDKLSFNSISTFRHHPF